MPAASPKKMLASTTDASVPSVVPVKMFQHSLQLCQFDLIVLALRFSY